MTVRVCIGDFLKKSQNWVEPKPDETYKQVTARLWGKGLTLRAEVFGTQIAATRQLQVKAGQFLLSRIDARHGACGLVPASLDGALVSNDFPCFDIASKVVLPAYFAWYARTENFTALCRRASEGSTNRVRLKEDAFLRMRVSLPPLDEQHRIVAKLDKVAALVARRSKVIEAAERDAKAMLSNAFRQIINGAPYRPMGRGRAPRPPSGGNRPRPKLSRTRRSLIRTRDVPQAGVGRFKIDVAKAFSHPGRRPRLQQHQSLGRGIRSRQARGSQPRWLPSLPDLCPG